MLGGMSGGGMGFIVAPEKKKHAQAELQAIMDETKQELESALPFAMDPVVYDFAINEHGTWGGFIDGRERFAAAKLLRARGAAVVAVRIAGVAAAPASGAGQICRCQPHEHGTARRGADGFDRLLPKSKREIAAGQSLAELLEQNAFDRAQHEQIRADLKNGRIGLAQNRLPASTKIEDVRPEDVIDATAKLPDECVELGKAALKDGEVAVVTLAAGVGSRWTQGAGVVKALHPFCKLSGQHRTFLEVHLAKSRRVNQQFGASLPHVITTSYLTHAPIETFLARQKNYGYDAPLALSSGKAIGLRMVPMVRDLRFMWEEMPQQLLDEQAQKVRLSLRAALIGWAQSAEAADYTDNLPAQCLHPVGH